MELRWYQAEAVEAAWKYMREKPGNPVIELPTGAGKSLVIAELTRQAVTQWGGRVLILQHVKELIEQNADELRNLCPTIRVGLYSAGLRRRETNAQVVFAGIQSVYDKADELGRFDLVLIDEGHLIPNDGDGMYRTLIAGLQEINPDIVMCGLTATPYRTGNGPICSAEGLLNAICFSVSVRTLILQGFLSKLIGRRAWSEVDTTGLHVRGGEFVESEAEERFMAAGVVEQACREIVTQCADRKSCLIFCQTVAHAEMVQRAIWSETSAEVERMRAQLAPARQSGEGSGFDLPEHVPEQSAVVPVAADWLEESGLPVDAIRRYMDHGVEQVGLITGETPADERAELIRQFKTGELKYLINVNVLTTGFNAKNVDCVAILRATLSPGLFYQMVGRGFRLCDGKENCLVLDFGQNIERHGPVDDIRPRVRGKGQDAEPITKECPECRAVVAPAVRECPGCNYVWPVEAREVSHNGTADGDPLSKGATEEVKTVTSVEYRVHTKKDAPDGAPKTLRVTYKCGLADYISEWVCVEHPEGGFAHQKAQKWWRKRCLAPMPKTAAEAVVYALHGLLAEPTEITVRTKKGEKFPEIVKQAVGDIPDSPPECPQCGQGVSILVRNDERYVPGNLACGMCNHTFGYVQQEVVNHYGYFDGSFEATGILPPEVFDAYDREESDAPLDSDDTRSTFDLLAAVDADNPF